MIRCLAIDDEPLALDVLDHHVRRCSQLTLVRKCRNAPEAYAVLQTEPIDLMFVDIKMPSISGIDFVRSLRQPPAVIFTTASAEHALTGFELDAVDYLLKPITFDRFLRSIQKLEKTRPPESPPLREYTYFKVSGRLLKIRHEDLILAQSVRDYIRLTTKQGACLTYMTMKTLEGELPKETFVRVHRSYVVNKSFITAVEKTQLQVGTVWVPIGETYRQVGRDSW